MCSQGRTHDSHPTPVIVSSIPTLVKSEPIVFRPVSVSSSVEVVRSQSRPDPNSAGIRVKLKSESPGVWIVRSRSRPESFNVTSNDSILAPVFSGPYTDSPSLLRLVMRILLVGPTFWSRIRVYSGFLLAFPITTLKRLVSDSLFLDSSNLFSESTNNSIFCNSTPWYTVNKNRLAVKVLK